MIVSFLDVAAQNLRLKHELSDAFGRVAAGPTLILGPEVAAFEREWANFCGYDYCIGVGSGLDALTLILRGYGIGPGDEVIVPVNTYIATWLAITAAGATIVPVDCNLEGNPDLRAVWKAFGPKTAAIMPVHLYGRETYVSMLTPVTRPDVKVIVDAAQGHGLLELGDAAGFSFYPTKNLGALGDGGAVVTDDPELAERVRALRNYGAVVKNEHRMIGANSRLDELQASFLRSKLTELPAWNAARARNARIYLDMLAGVPNVLLPADGESVWHLFVIQHKNRDQLRANLAARGIGTEIHYPTPPHLQPAYAHLGYRAGDFPIAEMFARECLSLPIGPELSEDQVCYVAEQIRLCA